MFFFYVYKDVSNVVALFLIHNSPFVNPEPSHHILTTTELRNTRGLRPHYYAFILKWKTSLMVPHYSSKFNLQKWKPFETYRHCPSL